MAYDRCTKVLRVATITLAPGLLPAFVMLVLGRNVPLRAVAFSALSGVAYSTCISGLCWWILPKLAPGFMRQAPARKWISLLGTMAAIAAVGCLLASTILLVLGIAHSDDFWRDFLNSLKLCLILTLIFGVASFLYEVVIHRLQDATRDAERLRRMATEARLSSLESRVHPHFLFNTLNSISALIREDPERAERTVERLASLLRFSLDANELRLVPLSLELKIVRDYLEIEKTRFGSRLRYSIDIPDSMSDVQVLPMSIQTLVENSVKHAVSVRREGAQIDVRARVDSAGVPSIDVIDDGPGYDSTAILTGHGLDLLRSRLALVPGAGASLQIAPESGRMRTTVVLA